MAPRNQTADQYQFGASATLSVSDYFSNSEEDNGQRFIDHLASLNDQHHIKLLILDRKLTDTQWTRLISTFEKYATLQALHITSKANLGTTADSLSRARSLFTNNQGIAAIGCADQHPNLANFLDAAIEQLPSLNGVFLGELCEPDPDDYSSHETCLEIDDDLAASLTAFIENDVPDSRLSMLNCSITEEAAERLKPALANADHFAEIALRHDWDQSQPNDDEPTDENSILPLVDSVLAMPSNSLRRIDLSGFELDENNVSRLALMLRWSDTKVTSVTVDGVITAQAASPLIRAIQANTTLHTLSLRRNAFNSQPSDFVRAFPHFLSIVASHRTLRAIDLSQNADGASFFSGNTATTSRCDFWVDQFDKFAQAYKRNPVLITLALPDPNILIDVSDDEGLDSDMAVAQLARFDSPLKTIAAIELVRKHFAQPGAIASNLPDAASLIVRLASIEFNLLTHGQNASQTVRLVENAQGQPEIRAAANQLTHYAQAPAHTGAVLLALTSRTSARGGNTQLPGSNSSYSNRPY